MIVFVKVNEGLCCVCDGLINQVFLFDECDCLIDLILVILLVIVVYDGMGVVILSLLGGILLFGMEQVMIGVVIVVDGWFILLVMGFSGSFVVVFQSGMLLGQVDVVDYIVMQCSVFDILVNSFVVVVNI